jgi:four helix bundle protein
MSGTFEDLRAWQCSMSLALEIYRTTNDFPKHEIYGLTSQLRRAAVSVPSNIAEGKGRNSDKELCQFLNHARGSVCEVQTQLMLAQRIGYLDKLQGDRLLAQAAEVVRLLNGLIRSFRQASVNASCAAGIASLKPQASSLRPEA